MQCNWLLAYGPAGKRVFEGCFNTKKAAEKKADLLNSPYCMNPWYKGLCWRPVFNRPPGVPLRGPTRRLTVPERHQLKVACDTLKMPDAMVAMMSEMTKKEARAIIKRLTGKAPRSR